MTKLRNNILAALLFLNVVWLALFTTMYIVYFEPGNWRNSAEPVDNPFKKKDTWLLSRKILIFLTVCCPFHTWTSIGNCSGIVTQQYYYSILPGMRCFTRNEIYFANVPISVKNEWFIHEKKQYVYAVHKNVSSMMTSYDLAEKSQKLVSIRVQLNKRKWIKIMRD